MRMIIEYASCFLETALCFYFFTSFERRKFSVKTSAAILGVISLVYGMAVAVFDINKIQLILFSFIFTLIISFCCRFKWYNAIFMTLIFSGISALSELLVMQTTVYIGQANFNTVNENIYAYICGMLSSKIITYIIILIIRKRNHKSFQSIGGMRFLGLLTLPFSTVVLSMVFPYMMLRYISDDLMKFLSLVPLVLLIVSNITIFSIVDAQYELISAREKLEASEMLLTAQKQYYEDIFRSQQEIRKTRHDLKNVFIALLGQLNSSDILRCREIIQNKLDELEQSVDLSSDVDNMVDAIIHSKVNDAQKSGVNLNVRKNIDRPVNIESLDLSVLIANILDNAIEATRMAEDKRQIDFSMFTENDSLIILSCNPTINNFSDVNFSTTKKDKAHHGFGTLSIQSVAKKYNGDYILRYENYQAYVTVILNNGMQMST